MTALTVLRARVAKSEENASRVTDMARRESLLRAAAVWSKMAQEIATELGINKHSECSSRARRTAGAEQASVAG